MGDKFKVFLDKAGDFYLKLTKKFDGVSQKIYEQTGKKINIGAIVGGVLLGAVTLCIVSLILGMIRDFLFGVS